MESSIVVNVWHLNTLLTTDTESYKNASMIPSNIIHFNKS